MSQQRSRRDSLDDSSETSSFDSHEELSDLEEEEEPRQTERQEKKTWVMRSGPSRSKSDSQTYAPVAGDDDDQYGMDQSLGDDKYGDTGMGGDDYSTAEKGGTKSDAVSSGQDPSGEYTDDENGQDQDTTKKTKNSGGKEKNKGNNKKIWLWVGLAAILLLLILLAVYWFWLRSKPDKAESENKGSSSSSSSNSTSSSLNSSISNVLPSSSSKPLTTLPASNNTLPTTSLQLTPASTAIVKPVNSSSVRPAPTSTSTAEDSASTFFAQITWFNDEDIVTPCGSNPNDGDYVVRVSQELYGNPNSVSSVCGKWISLYQLETNSYTKATIEGVCSDCTGNNVVLSRATFWALTQNMKLGTTLAQWWWTPKEDRPENTLKSEAPVAQVTGQARPQPASSPSTNSTQVSNSDLESVEADQAGGKDGAAQDTTQELTP
ncbi:RlpA-like double-psi beta-barrel domain-containing protein [Sporobolomyces salmoneus]|uniref:RlpA-like double-psi beta-barrel domain-containing protein n=1 Tax=Sporobolomyces salmoneus TaxID=183962 RepID=UPI003173A3D1